VSIAVLVIVKVDETLEDPVLCVELIAKEAAVVS
jgi:hypothetical protein